MEVQMRAGEELLTILLVDHQRLVCEALSSVLERAGHHVLGQATDRATAVRMMNAFRPRVVLLDLDLPDGSSLGLVRYIRCYHPQTRIVALASPAHGHGLCPTILTDTDGYI